MKNKALLVLFLLSVAMNVGVVGTVVYARVTGAAAAKTGTSLRDELRLSDEQVRGFTEHRTALHQQVLPLREHMLAQRRAFFDLLARPTQDPAAVDAILREMNRTQADMQRAAAEYLLAQRELLTPEQATAFVRFLARQPAAGRHLPLLGSGGAPLPDERR